MSASVWTGLIALVNGFCTLCQIAKREATPLLRGVRILNQIIASCQFYLVEKELKHIFIFLGEENYF